MHIHEHQAKEILARYGVKVPRGRMASTPWGAEAAAKEIGPGPFVVKAQIHAGGRGKAGGIRRANTPAEVGQAARALIGRRLATPQTGPEGKPVGRVLIEESLPIARELYLAVTIDQKAGKAVVIASSAGGMDIEEVGARSPEKIYREAVNGAVGLQPFQGRKLAAAMGLEGPQIAKAAQAALGLYRAFLENDCSLAEINPLGLTPDGELLAFDAKMNVDDNALYRQPGIRALRDTDQEDPRDIEAAKLGLNFVNLRGNIGCIVNGAGLGMATLDILLYYGGEAANFLDAGAGASKDVICNAFKLLLSDPKVKGILINMFGGITRCDSYAQGIVDASREISFTVPLVVRLEGTNVELGRRILAESGLNLISASSMEEAAQKIIALVKSA
ncbi:MAG: ADP-forming succinate--CoA ligase subunit beta [Deltaproteobacteria bacterium]|nr:ADP-forming succinate--CoA ligase subunit beta [Deltaproteobacteria bacterium]